MQAKQKGTFQPIPPEILRVRLSGLPHTLPLGLALPLINLLTLVPLS